MSVVTFVIYIFYTACACSAGHIITICRIALHPELILCRESCILEAYDSGVVLSAEYLQFSELVVKLVDIKVDQLFTSHERHLAHSVNDVSTSHTPDVAVTVPGGVPELVAVVALYRVVLFLKVNDPNPNISYCLQVFNILKGHGGFCN